MPTANLRGVYAAAVTPLTADLEPDLKAFVGHCRWLMDNGCDGLAPLGTTGEANSFSGDQKLRILEALALSGLPVGRMIVGTGAESPRFSRTSGASASSSCFVKWPSRSPRRRSTSSSACSSPRAASTT
jgi:dihydrodipicolinate synthase/N-acetylneuraminate lyase